MQTKVVVFGKIDKNLEKYLHERAIFDALSCFNFDDCLKICNEFCAESKKIVVLCENEHVDELAEKIKTADDTLSLINDQAVKIERQTVYKTIFIVPIEADYGALLEQVLQRKEKYVKSVFGKTKAFLNEKLSELKGTFGSDFWFEIVSESEFLHIVYSSKQIQNEIFEGAVYSNEKECLAGVVSKLLGDKKIVIAENLTAGLLTAELSKTCKLNLLGAEIVCNDKNFDNIGIDELFLEQNGTVSKETAFAMAKNMLRTQNAEITVAVTGFDCDAGRCFVAVGNKTEIYVHSSVFYGEHDNIVENAVNFALFKTICFLKEKYQ